MRGFVVLAALPLLASGTAADTYVVAPDGSGDFPVIQAAIDASVNGDVIELTDGTFSGDGNRDLRFLGKAITVRSQSGNPDACVIDCGGTPSEPHIGFLFDDFVEQSSVVEDLTVTGAYSDEEAAITIYTGGPSILGCVVRDNAATGIARFALDKLGEVLVADCLIVGNSGPNTGGIRALAAMRIEGSTITANGGRISGVGAGQDVITLVRTIVWGNCEAEVGEIVLGQGKVGFECSVFDPERIAIIGPGSYGSNESVMEDPQFCDPFICTNDPSSAGVYTIAESSPAAPLNSPCGELIGYFGVDCAAVPVEPVSWGRLKERFVDTP